MVCKTIQFFQFVVIFSITFAEERGYLINTDKCKIPDIKLHNDDINTIIYPMNYIPCRNTSELLSYVTKSKNSTTLHIREELLPLYSIKIGDNVTCCYSNVDSNKWDNTTNHPCKLFQKQVVLYHDTVEVSCSSASNGKFYENVHNPITVKKSIEDKLSRRKIVKPLSVLIISIDSLSRLNFFRTMSKTANYLLQNGFIEMQVYHKVGDDTFPNIMALLAGFDKNSTSRICKPYQKGGLDECPLIWHNYSNLGYVTAYAEDFDEMNTFTCLGKAGFTKPPTDYYFENYIAAAEALPRDDNHFGMPYCTGPETAGERILNLAKDFVTTFKNQPIFGVFWMNSFSHNDISMPFTMDDKVTDFFKYIKGLGVLNDTVVMFMSDHGIRYGKVRFTVSGWFEERLPVNMISVPKTFRERFTKEYSNLLQNSKKLTTPYDMFMTLQHILTLSGFSYPIRKSRGCPSCVSLFEKIPKVRSCEDVGIIPQVCACSGYFHGINADHEFVKDASRFVSLKVFNRSDVVQGHVVNPTISEINSDGFSYLFFNFKSNNTIFLVTVKFKYRIDKNSIFSIAKLHPHDHHTDRQY